MALFTISLDTSDGDLEAETFEIAKSGPSGELTEAVMNFVRGKILAPGDTISIKLLNEEPPYWSRPTSGTEDDEHPF